MQMQLSGSGAFRRPVTALLLLFAASKAFLLAIALGSCAGAAYDTSADLALNTGGLGNSSTPTLVTRLTSWDAIYFTQVARRGYLFEQEWAFGSGLPLVISLLVRALRALGIEDSSYLEPVAGALVANTSHLLSVFVLYRLARLAFEDVGPALVAASLHIFSPAGLFLSAPCAESTFALLNFTGHLLFAESLRTRRKPARRDALTLLAGISFGLATAFRSNGILSGVLFAWHTIPQLARLPRHPSAAFRRLLVLGIGGACVATGSIVPQFVAYRRFCVGASEAGLRPWCQGYLPSIYTFVQQHYWNVGLFRYWTFSNLPLFLIAAPTLGLLIVSGLDQLRLDVDSSDTKGSPAFAALAQPAAAAQILLALLAVATYHVQIVNRISSGYPLLYIWLARRLFSQGPKGAYAVVRIMVIYASIQGVLFASFLPPA